jgi:predicted enzyme related to lactoylglutathione lyase
MVVYLDVDDMDKAMARVIQCGGKEHEAKQDIAHGWIAVFEDSEGNFVG